MTVVLQIISLITINVFLNHYIQNPFGHQSQFFLGLLFHYFKQE